jgi:hypothetical protein
VVIRPLAHSILKVKGWVAVIVEIITCEAGSCYMFDAPELQAPRLSLGLRNKAIIRSGMKSILNFRHNIEKYGFLV